MFGYIPMRPHRLAGIRRALPIDMRLEITGKVLHCRHHRMHGIDAEATERAIRHIARELFQQVEVALVANAADDAFQRPGDAFDADATRHTLTASLFGERRSEEH